MHSLKLLSTHGWEKTDDASFGYDALPLLAGFQCRWSMQMLSAVSYNWSEIT